LIARSRRQLTARDRRAQQISGLLIDRPITGRITPAKEDSSKFGRVDDHSPYPGESCARAVALPMRTPAARLTDHLASRFPPHRSLLWLLRLTLVREAVPQSGSAEPLIGRPDCEMRLYTFFTKDQRVPVHAVVPQTSVLRVRESQTTGTSSD
jgi:hypothetical protein